MAIRDTGEGPNLIKKDFILSSWTPVVRAVTTSHVQSTSNNLIEVRKIISLHAQIRQVSNTVEMILVSGLSTTMLLGTASIVWYIKKVSPRTRKINPVSSVPAADTD